MARRLNHCRDSGASGFGGSMGGMRRSERNKVTCPSCGKRVQVTREGRLRAHGTYVEDRIPCPTEGCPNEAVVDYLAGELTAQECDECAAS